MITFIGDNVNKAVIFANGIFLLLFLGMVYVVSVLTVPFFGLLFLAFVPIGIFEMFEYYNKHHYQIAVVLFLVLGMILSIIYFYTTTSEGLLILIMGNALIFGIFGSVMFFLASRFPKMGRWDQKSLVKAGIGFRNQKRYQESIKCFYDATEINSNFDQAWYEKGITLLDMGEYQEAEECFKKDRKIGLNSRFKVLQWQNKGLNLYNLGYYKAAQGYYDKYIEKKPKSSAALIGKSAVLLHLKQYDEALKICDELINNNAKSGVAWNNKAFILAKLKRLDEALKCVEKSLKISPKTAHAFHTRGYILSKMGRYQEALECYNNSLQAKDQLEKWYLKHNKLMMQILAKNKAGRWYNKGKVLQEMGRIEEAIECYMNALKFNPKYEPAKEALEPIKNMNK